MSSTGDKLLPFTVQSGQEKLLKATGHGHIFHQEPTQHRNEICNLWYNTARATWVRAAHAWPRLELFKEHEKIKERSDAAFIFQENWRDFAALLKCFEPEILSQIQLCRQEITELHYAVFLQQADKAEFITKRVPSLYASVVVKPGQIYLSSQIKSDIPHFRLSVPIALYRYNQRQLVPQKRSSCTKSWRAPCRRELLLL